AGLLIVQIVGIGFHTAIRVLDLDQITVAVIGIVGSVFVAVHGRGNTIFLIIGICPDVIFRIDDTHDIVVLVVAVLGYVPQSIRFGLNEAGFGVGVSRHPAHRIRSCQRTVVLVVGVGRGVDIFISGGQQVAIFIISIGFKGAILVGELGQTTHSVILIADTGGIAAFLGKFI